MAKRYNILLPLISCLTAGFLLFAAGCAKHETQQQDIQPIPGLTQEKELLPISEPWWKDFADPELNKLIDQALQDNFSLQAAHERLEASGHALTRERAELYPELDSEAAFSWRDDDVGSNTMRDRDTINFSYDVTASYEVDLWGRIAAEADAYGYEYQATKAELQTAGVTLAANVAQAWYEILEARKQKKLQQEQLQAEQELLSLLQTRFSQGQIRLAEVQQQKRKVAAARSNSAQTAARLKTLKHELAVLLGEEPGQINDLQQKDLPEPSAPPDHLQMAFIQQRPDVRSAFFEIKEQDSQVARAIAERYPRMNLSLSGMTQSDNLPDLFSSWAGQFTAGIAGPLLDAGRRQAEVDRHQAIKSQKIYDYGQVVLTALQEAQDALALEKARRERLQNYNQEYQLARESHQQALARYQHGSINYSEVIAEQLQMLQAKQNLVTTRQELITSRIELYRTLSGGWEV